MNGISHSCLRRCAKSGTGIRGQDTRVRGLLSYGSLLSHHFLSCYNDYKNENESGTKNEADVTSLKIMFFLDGSIDVHNGGSKY